MRSRVRHTLYAGMVFSLLVFLLSGGAMTVEAAVSGLTLYSPAPGTYAEDDDYFTTVWGNPRDMDDMSDVYYINSTCPGSPLRPKWQNISLSNGMWQATTSSAGENRWVYVLNPGWVSSLDVLEDGGIVPVDASKYTQLTFRMYFETGGSFVALAFTDDEIGAPDPYDTINFSTFAGWNIYTIDMSADPGWSGDITGIWFDFIPLGAGIDVKLDWARLTPKQNREIRWTGSGTGAVNVYASTDPTFGNAEQTSRLRIYDPGLVGVKANDQSLIVPASFPGAKYYFRIQEGAQKADSTPNFWEIKEVPIAQIVAPSYTSGEDFATTVVGNPWDFEGTDDVNAGWTDNDPGQAGLIYTASGGILDLTNVDDGLALCDTRWPHRPLALNRDGQRIDPNRYRYLTYRYKVDDAPDQVPGGVMRIRWLDTDKWWAGRTDDISLYHNGWIVYKLDLAALIGEDLEHETANWTATSWDVFQLTVNESHRAWKGHLDWVKLTAANEAHSTYTVGWNLVNVSDVMTATVYWDTDRNPTNGLASVGQIYVPPTSTVPPPPTGPEFVYLPLLANRYDPQAVDVDAQFSLVLDASGLSVGSDYWVAIKLEDGYNTAWWYSELPVRKL